MSKIIVALDGMTLARAQELATAAQGKVWGFKVNDLLFDAGVVCISSLRNFGNVMADPKLYDIGNTIANGVKKLYSAGANLITVHASAGPTGLKAANEAATHAKILAITVLTSMPDDEMERIYHVKERHALVREFATIAKDAGCGIVCAAPDLEQLDDIDLKVVPGYRGIAVKGDDQVHTGGSDTDWSEATYVVVGRPITQAEDPIAAINKINEDLS